MPADRKPLRSRAGISRMSHQSEADDREDDAAEDVAVHGAHKSRQDLPGRGEADPERAFAMDSLLPKCSSLNQHGGARQAWMRTDLARLESAFPAFSFAICSGWHGPRFEAWRDTAPSGLYAIITDDPHEMWHELDRAAR